MGNIIPAANCSKVEVVCDNEKCACFHFVFQNFTNRLTNDTTNLTGNEGQKMCAVFSENAQLQS